MSVGCFFFLQQGKKKRRKREKQQDSNTGKHPMPKYLISPFSDTMTLCFSTRITNSQCQLYSIRENSVKCQHALAHNILGVFEAGCVSNVKPPTHSPFHVTWITNIFIPSTQNFMSLSTLSLKCQSDVKTVFSFPSSKIFSRYVVIINQWSEENTHIEVPHMSSLDLCIMITL